MDSNLGLLLLHGKIIKSTLRRIQPHVDTLSESVTITDFIQRYILSTVNAFIDDSENRLLPNNVMMIRNYRGDKEGLKERRGQRTSKGSQAKLESNPSRAEIQFGFQEQSALKSAPRSHTNSVLDILYMDGKIRGSTFQWS
jgi:hypothetical protein